MGVILAACLEIFAAARDVWASAFQATELANRIAVVAVRTSSLCICNLPDLVVERYSALSRAVPCAKSNRLRVLSPMIIVDVTIFSSPNAVPAYTPQRSSRAAIIPGRGRSSQSRPI